MREEIKQRIEKIRRGEVPEGYKRTKVGIVPEEWEEGFLGNYIQEYKELSNDIEKYPVYSSSRQGLIPQSQYYDNREAVETNLGYKIVPNGYVTYRHMSDDDVFHFNVNNTGGEILVSSEYPVFSSTEKSSLGYIIPMLNDTAHFRYFCRTQKMGGTRTRLYYKNLCTYKSVYPPLAEQEKIGEILQTQDKLIALKEKLIEEKKRQKKYLMQLLLTGKKRLPGVGGEWTASKIKDVTEISAGATPDTNNPEFWGGNIKWMNSGELNNKHIYDVVGRITETGLSKTSTKLLPQKCVLIGLAGQGKTRGTAAINYIELCTNQSIAAIHPCDMWIPEFLYYSLDMRYDELRMISSGDGTRGGLNLKLIGDLIVKYPSYDEQEAIANVLSTTDKEISLLQKDLDQEKQKKKSLMQLLLTGIVRVK